MALQTLPDGGAFDGGLRGLRGQISAVAPTIGLPLVTPAFGNISLTPTDTAAATESMALGAATAPADSAAATDAAGVAASTPRSDAAAGTDATSVAATTAPAETAAGTDAASVAATTVPAETAAGTDVASVAATTAPAETAAGTDAASVAATIATTDAAAGADATSVAATIALADSATGTDALDPGSTPVAGSESGTGVETLQVQATAPAEDLAAGADMAGLLAALDLQDSAVGDDTITVGMTGSNPPAGGGSARMWPARRPAAAWLAPQPPWAHLPAALQQLAAQLERATGLSAAQVTALLPAADQAQGLDGMHIERLDPDLDLVNLALSL